MPCGPVEAAQRVIGDIRCAQCGYNLRGAATGAKCPECGAAIGDSLRACGLRSASPAWLRGLRRGYTLLAIAQAGFFAFGFAGIGFNILAQTTSGAISSGARFIGQFAFAGLAAIALAAWVGFWLVTSPNPAVAGRRTARSGDVVRVASTALLAALAFLSFRHFGVLTHPLLDRTDAVGFVIFVVAGVVLMGAFDRALKRLMHDAGWVGARFTLTDARSALRAAVNHHVTRARSVLAARTQGRDVETEGTPPRRPLLTAEWRHLAMLNYEIDPQVLSPFVPAGVELDLWRGRALVSMVGFMFSDTRIWGLSVPFHRTFAEVNLRFYVQREVDGVRRRGVVFIREIVPRRAIAFLARRLYNEPYVARPMTHRIEPRAARGPDPGGLYVAYGWRAAAGACRLSIDVAGAPQPPAPGSEAEFITEHYWGYTRQPDGSTLEYEVTHPPWRGWCDAVGSFEGDARELYGDAFAGIITRPPDSAHLAEGSAVAVYRGVRLAAP